MDDATTSTAQQHAVRITCAAVLTAVLAIGVGGADAARKISPAKLMCDKPIAKKLVKKGVSTTKTSGLCFKQPGKAL